MERSATAFSAADRIGQLAVQINDIQDSREKLAQLRGVGLTGGAAADALGTGA